jgi:serine kinase of HPr protein (carbohydrate metabolism regulator)
MGRAQMDNAWITIMSNVNVIAVATLADTACVVLAEGVAMPEELVQTAEAKDVNILSSAEPIYETAVKLAGLLS